MTIRYASKFGPNFENTLYAIGHTQEFDAGNLRGERATLPAWITPGSQLSGDWLEQFRNDKPLYVVFSYGTPIAWVVSRNGKKVAVVPPVKYGSTTSAHQNVARRGFGEYTEQLHG